MNNTNKCDSIYTVLKKLKREKLKLKHKKLQLRATIDCVEINSYENDGTPSLFRACRDSKVLEMFLAHPKIDVNIKDTNGWTALMNACAYGEVNAVKRLCKVPGIDLNHQNSIGYTAAIIAIVNNNAECVKILSNIPGVNWNIKTKMNYTAVNYARQTEIIQILSTVPGVDWNIESSIRILPLKFALNECSMDNLKILLRNPTVKNATVLCETPMEYLKKKRQEVFNELINIISEEPTPDDDDDERPAKRQKMDVIKVPECPVCCERFDRNSEVYHCNQWHWVCGRCYEQIDVCQKCKWKIIGRSHDLEELLQENNL